jgi:ribose 1,5-bisphosphokinase PhnN
MIEYEVENDALRTRLEERGKEAKLAKEMLQ